MTREKRVVGWLPVQGVRRKGVRPEHVKLDPRRRICPTELEFNPGIAARSDIGKLLFALFQRNFSLAVKGAAQEIATKDVCWEIVARLDQDANRIQVIFNGEAQDRAALFPEGIERRFSAAEYVHDA